MIKHAESMLEDIQQKINKVQNDMAYLRNEPADIAHTEITVTDENCEKHGAYQALSRNTTVLIKLKPIKTRCPQCMSESLDELIKSKGNLIRGINGMKVDALMEELGVPERFNSATLDNYKTTSPESERALKVCKLYADKWPDRLANGGGLVMCGKPGTGKNHLALAIAKHVVINHQSSAIFTTALRVARAFKSTWAKSSEITESDVIKIYTSPDLLIMDEIGVQFGSDTEKLIIFEIINTRYEQMKPTIIISNQTKEELIEFIGERVIDRMNDGGGCTLSFTWDSYRGAK